MGAPHLSRVGFDGGGEDIVQEAWIRWHGAERREPGAFLTRVVTRLCLDTMKSARARREAYAGHWLPEPIVELDDEETLPLDELTLTLMLVLVLERLSPLEPATFLHDVFGISTDEVAATLRRDTATERQLAVRAHRHIQDSRPRFHVDRTRASR